MSGRPRRLTCVPAQGPTQVHQVDVAALIVRAEDLARRETLLAVREILRGLKLRKTDSGRSWDTVEVGASEAVAQINAGLDRLERGDHA